VCLQTEFESGVVCFLRGVLLVYIPIYVLAEWLIWRMTVHHHCNKSLSLQPHISHFGRGFGPVVRQTTKWMNIYVVLVYRHCKAPWLLYLPSGLTLNNVTLSWTVRVRSANGVMLWAVRTPALQRGGFADSEMA